jgi:beta-galactosidase
VVEPAALRAGAVDYWRLGRDQWAAALEAVADAGFNAVCLAIPWEVHEIKPGRFDFGRLDPRKDIGVFLSLCQRQGLQVVAQVGPQVGSGLTTLGYPGRLLERRELLARSAQGSLVVLTRAPRPVPLVSYAAPEFYAEVATWYDAICPILAAHAHPRGAVVAAQVDHGLAYQSHANLYACDYSQASLARYREFAAAKHGGLAGLGRAYGRQLADLAELDPPRRFAALGAKDIPYHADWAEYRERYLVDGIGQLAGMLRARGLGGVALFHCAPPPGANPAALFDLCALEAAVDFAGCGIDSRQAEYAQVKAAASYLAGTSRSPFSPELETGVAAWRVGPGDLRDEEFAVKAALMCGLRGFSRHPVVERSGWLEAPIRPRRAPREDSLAMHARANQMLERLGWARLERVAPVLLLANREYDRLEAACALVSFPGDLLETPSGLAAQPGGPAASTDRLGFDQAVQVAKNTWFEAFAQAAAASGAGWLLSDTAAPLERLAAREVVAVATFDYLDRATQAKLVAYAWGGGGLVIGPKVPRLDSAMAPCDVLRDAVQAARAAAAGEPAARAGQADAAGQAGGLGGPVGAGRIWVAPSLAEAPAAIRQALDWRGAPALGLNDGRLDAAVHRDPEDPARRVVFVANPAACAIDAALDLGADLRQVVEAWEDRAAAFDGSVVAERLEPRAIRVYDCRLAG